MTTPLIITAKGGLLPITWQAQGLPDGLELDLNGDDTGKLDDPRAVEIVGTVDADAGAYPVTITATDRMGNTATLTRTLVVHAADEFDFDTEAADFPLLTVGEPVAFQLLTVNGDGNITFAVSEGGDALPEGLALTPDGLLHGTPTTAADGSDSDVDFTAVDGLGREAQLNDVGFAIFGIDIAELPAGQVGEVYNQSITTKGDVGSVTFSLDTEEGDDLPAGLSLNGASGAITGTPEAATQGTYDLLVTAEDDDTGQSDVIRSHTRSVELVIAPAT